MQGDFSELSRHFDDKFEELKRRLFDLENKFLEMSRKIDDLQRNKTDKTDLNNITNTLNDHVRKAEVAFQQINEMTRKVDNCERQLNELSGRIK
ncbi:MAG: hypothetical protein HYT21_02805 [Candidatus Nealsonbacteria bacterium]|nr:hypothetical protein [Candidatus Nealsonbacteria bacterium]